MSNVRQQTAAIASGDSEAFAQLYDAKFDLMYAEARRLTRRDEAFCLDVVQDAMMKVIKRIPVIDEDAKLDAWLRVATRSAAYDRLRADRRRAERERRTVDAAPDPQEQSDAESRAELRRLLDEVDDPTHDMLIMRYRFGWSLRRIAETCQLTVSAADGRIRRALAGFAARDAAASEEDLT